MSYFPPPRRVETTVFARLPDRFRRPRPTAWADANRAGKEIDSFLEGPAFDRQGRLYVTDIPFGRVFRVSPEGEWEQVAEYDGWPNGLKIHRDGRLFITDYGAPDRDYMLDSQALTPQRLALWLLALRLRLFLRCGRLLLLLGLLLALALRRSILGELP